MKNTPFHLLQWQWDILGGLEAETCIRGNYDSAVYTVQSNQVIIPSSKGGGKVHHVRGIWLPAVEFSWDGYWSAVNTAGATNYFTGGSAQNSGDQTTITLGTGLANGAQVQVYYAYGNGTFFKADTPVEAYPAFFNAWQGEGRYKFSSAPDGDQWIALAMLEARARWEDFKFCYGWSLMESLEKFLEDPDYSIIDDFERDAARTRDNSKEFYSGADSNSSITPEIVEGAAQGRQSRILKVTGNVAAAGYGYWGEGRNVAVPIGENGFKFLFKGQGNKKTHILRIADDLNWQTYFIKKGQPVKDHNDGGWWHCLALKEDKSAWAWGYGGQGVLGQDDFLHYHTPVRIKGVDGTGYLEDVIKIGTQWETCFAIDQAGNAYAWGKNDSGQLGTGSMSPAQSACPMKVKNADGSGYLIGIVDISGTHFYLGGATIFLESSGLVWMVGGGQYGQLGQGSGDTNNHLLPVKVKNYDGNGYLSNIKKVWGGVASSFALDSVGYLWAWGNNLGGWLGVGGILNRYLPTKVGEITQYLMNIQDLDSGSNINSPPYFDRGHVVACQDDGTCWTWGTNPYGALGAGSIMVRYFPGKVCGVGGVGFLTGIVRVCATENDSFALDGDGYVYGWGKNEYGELGQGDTSQQFYPVKIKNIWGSEGYLTDIISIWASEDSSVYALRNDGVLFSIGRNHYGQLGDGTTTDRHFPVKVQNHVWWADIVPGVYKFPVHDTATGWREINPKFTEFVRDTNLLWDGDRKAGEIWGTYVPAFPQYNKITLGYNDRPDHVEGDYRHFKALRIDMELFPVWDGGYGPKTPAEVGVATTPDVNSYATANLNFLLRLYTAFPGLPTVRVKIQGADGREHFKYLDGLDFTFWQRVTIPWQEFDNQGENGKDPILHPILALDFIFRVDGHWYQFMTCSAHLDDVKFGDHKTFQDWIDLE